VTASAPAAASGSTRAAADGRSGMVMVDMVRLLSR
jgi:hypothetical protein